MDEKTKKLVDIWHYVPDKTNRRPEIHRIWCSLPENLKCPFLERGECLEKANYFSFGCIYGRASIQRGPTLRAKSSAAFIKEAKAAVEAGPQRLAFPKKHLTVLGDYVYIPYAHAAMCRSVPFVAHGGAFKMEKPFISVKAFTPQIVVSLANFRPQALIGGEIKQYQEKSVPLFLFHLKYMMPDIYNAAVKLNPKILEKTFDIANLETLKATLSCIKPGIINGYTIGSKKLQVKAWDGKHLEISGERENFPFFLHNFEGSNFVLKFEPIPEKTKIIVTSKKLIEQILVDHPEALTEIVEHFIEKCSFEV